jgi:hypothetical protein
MKDRLVTLGLAVCALALFWALFVPKPEPAETAPPLPLSTETRASGYLAAWRWLAAEQVREVAWHERFDRLPEDTMLSAGGNVLFTTLPNKLPIGAREAVRLDAWVERGNTLVVLAALDDTPAWALTSSSQLIEQVGRLTRLRFDALPEDNPKSGGAVVRAALDAWGAPRAGLIEPIGVQPLLEGVHSVQVSSDLPASRWRATPMDAAAVLDLAKLSANNDAVLWLKRQGRGQIITFAFAGVFSNRDLGSADNGKLLANIIAWALQPGGAVIFDDAHQGAVNFYDAKAFFADARLHRTLAWLVLLWFVFVLGVQRLRVHAQEWRSADITAFIGITGGFFASTLTPPAAAARLLENFFDGVRLRAPLSSAELSALRDLHARAQAGQRVDLEKLQNLLHTLQGKIE